MRKHRKAMYMEKEQEEGGAGLSAGGKFEEIY